MLRNTGIFEQYIARTPRSRALFQRALEVFPGGVTHDTRLLKPYPLYVERAAGSRKWDVDGHQYVDYLGGHGALLLGHCHPAVVDAVRQQVGKGTHYSASHELEVQWGEQIQAMVPCAQRVRFTGSGTESTMLAIRLARAYTGKEKIVRFAGHFHGWHDQVAFAVTSHFDGSAPAGVLHDVARGAIVCPPNDATALAQILDQHDDVAAVIVEPTGATFGLVPLVDGFLRQVRELTTRKNVVLIFDEVITGFRVAPGGAQQHYGITPELATFAKVVAGGLPGGAVAGRQDILDMISPRDDAQWNVQHRVPHQGTFNANPLSAAAGLATLKLVAEGEVVARANQLGQRLRDRLNEVIQAAGVPWVAYGQFSGFHLFTNPRGRAVGADDLNQGKISTEELKGATSGSLAHEIRCGFILNGVDLFPWPGGCVSAVHTDEDIELTAEALSRCLQLLPIKTTG